MGLVVVFRGGVEESWSCMASSPIRPLPHPATTAHRHTHTRQPTPLSLQERLGITLRKMDELECLMRGLEFVLQHVVGECYTYKPDRAPSTPVRLCVCFVWIFWPCFLLCVCVCVCVCVPACPPCFRASDV
jgi:hypothetical protein